MRLSSLLLRLRRTPASLRLILCRCHPSRRSPASFDGSRSKPFQHDYRFVNPLPLFMQIGKHLRDGHDGRIAVVRVRGGSQRRRITDNRVAERLRCLPELFASLERASPRIFTKRAVARLISLTARRIATDSDICIYAPRDKFPNWSLEANQAERLRKIYPFSASRSHVLKHGSASARNVFCRRCSDAD